MANNLYDRFGKVNQRNNVNILSQLAMVKKNPSAILDILLNNGKINQQQYVELQNYKNNPQEIFNYLWKHGNQEQLSSASQVANQNKDVM